MDSHAPALAVSGPVPGFTRRQLQIVQLLKTGASNKEIAQALRIREGTVQVDPRGSRLQVEASWLFYSFRLR